MRIAHLGSKGIPSKGGTERVVEAVAMRHARDHDVTVYGSSAVCRSGVHGGVRVIAIGAAEAKHAGPVLLQLAAALHALVRGHYDVVHVHGSENGFVVPLLRLRYPVVTTNHGPAYEREKWSPLARHLIRVSERFSVQPATVATAVAANQAALLGKRYGRRVLHVPNGVRADEKPDTAAAAQLLAMHGVPVGEYVLFAAARVDPTKGCHTLLEACRRMAPAPPIVVLGDLAHASGYESRLRGLAEGLNVTFLPRLDDKATVLGILSQSRVFVFPSTVEAMSMILLEALALGVAILPSDIPENTSILPPDAHAFRAGDADDLRLKLSDLLSESRERQLAANTRSRDWVTVRYDWNAIADEYERTYRLALSS